MSQQPERQPQPDKHTPVESGSQANDRAQNTHRRTLLKAGIIAIPTMLTLSARPAWAQTGNPYDNHYTSQYSDGM